MRIQQEQSFNLKKSIMFLGAVLTLGTAVAGPPNATVILSTDATATLSGLTFTDGDLAEYDLSTDIATLYFDESLFSNNANIDAVYINTMPESATIALLGLGSLVLIRQRHNSRFSGR